MRVLALTFGDESCASSHYRVWQFIEPLRAFGIEMEPVSAAAFTDWARLAEYDAVLVQKKLFAVGRVWKIRQLARRLIYDVDDAIWEAHGRPHHWFTRWRTRLRLRRIVGAADVSLVANQVLAADLRRYSPRVHVLPMALDEAAWHSRRPSPALGRVRIGWAGAPVNLRYFEAIEPALVQVQARHPEAEFVVYSGQAPRLRQGLVVQHVPFALGTEPDVVRTFDIGLLPLPDNAFAAAKSPIKGLQYMACGVATVASPIGATLEMFRDGETALFAQQESEWTAALLRLVQEPARREQIGGRAYAEFGALHTRSRVAAVLAAILHPPSSESRGEQ